jgi:hypothetical protein
VVDLINKNLFVINDRYEIFKSKGLNVICVIKTAGIKHFKVHNAMVLTEGGHGHIKSNKK